MSRLLAIGYVASSLVTVACTTGEDASAPATTTPPSDPDHDAAYKKAWYIPRGDDKWISDFPDPANNTAWHLYNNGWLAGGYNEFYMPFVRAIVSRFRDDPAIMAWEIAGEVKSPNLDIGLTIQFFTSVAQQIKGIDPNHLISTGIISTRQAGITNPADQDRLFTNPNIDYVSVHKYDDEPEDDSAIAVRVNKPYVIAEFGFQMLSGRDAWYNRTSSYLQQTYDGQNAQSVGFWGIEYGEPHGESDTKFSAGREDLIARLWRTWMSRM